MGCLPCWNSWSLPVAGDRVRGRGERRRRQVVGVRDGPGAVEDRPGLLPPRRGPAVHGGTVLGPAVALSLERLRSLKCPSFSTQKAIVRVLLLRRRPPGRGPGAVVLQQGLVVVVAVVTVFLGVVGTTSCGSPVTDVVLHQTTAPVR